MRRGRETASEEVVSWRGKRIDRARVTNVHGLSKPFEYIFGDNSAGFISTGISGRLLTGYRSSDQLSLTNQVYGSLHPTRGSITKQKDAAVAPNIVVGCSLRAGILLGATFSQCTYTTTIMYIHIGIIVLFQSYPIECCGTLQKLTWLRSGVPGLSSSGSLCWARWSKSGMCWIRAWSSMYSEWLGNCYPPHSQELTFVTFLLKLSCSVMPWHMVLPRTKEKNRS